MKNISVIGAGTMGNGIAHVFAQNNFRVTLVDISEIALENAVKTIAGNLDRMLAKGSIVQADKDKTLAQISTEQVLAKGIMHADLVIEAATENTDLKLKIFKQMDQHAPAGCYPGHQYLFHLHYKNSRSNQPPGTGDRHAFYESGTGNETGGRSSMDMQPQMRSRN